MIPTPEFLDKSKGEDVIKIDGYYLYQIGAAIRPLVDLKESCTKKDMVTAIWGAEYYLDGLLNRSVYKLYLCRNIGNELLAEVKKIGESLAVEYDSTEEANWFDRYSITTKAKQFETVLGAELQYGQLFLVQPKGGYDLEQLTSQGQVIFPAGLIEKIPEAINDAQEAARCIAFALPTAAAFHLHRLAEIVLRIYYDTVTNGAPRPEKRNIESYIDAMKNAQFKDQKVFGALASLKNFHRNPVLHPDDRLEDIEEAIALLGVVNTLITYMLGAIKPAPLELVPSPANEEQAAITDKS